MNDAIRHLATATDDTLPPGLALDFDAIDETNDDLLARDIFQIREALSDFRNA